MADLFFKVHADYTELVSMQNEANRLKSELSNFSGSKEEFAELSNRVATLNAAVRDLATKGIKDAEGAFQSFAEGASKSIGGVDFSPFAKGAEDSASAAREFGAAWMSAMDSATSKDMDTAIANVKENMHGLQNLMIDVQQAMNSTNNPAATAALQGYMSELERLYNFYNSIGLAAKQMKEDMAAPVGTQNTESLEDAEQRKALLEQMQALYDSEIQKQQKLGNEYDKAAVALEHYKQQYVEMLSQGGSKQEMSALRENIATTSIAMQSIETQVEQSKTKTTQLSSAMGEVKNNTQMSSLEAAQMAMQFDNGANSGMRLRTEMMMAREQMARMIQDGQSGSLQFVQMAEKAGELRKVFTVASAKMSYYANPTKGFATTTAALQGMAGAAKVAVGVYGLFNKKQEDLIKIQTTIQSLMAITSGLQAVYNMRSAKSAVMQGILYVQDQLRKKVLIDLAVAQEMENVATTQGTAVAGADAVATTADAAAKGAATAATVKLTIAQRMFNAVANANPYVLLASALVAVIGAVWALASANKKAKQAEEEAAKATQKRADVEKAYTSAYSQQATQLVAKYDLLRRKWVSLKSVQEKNQFIKDNKSAFEELGWAVSSVSQAEELLVRKTGSVVKAFQLRAKAAALEAQAQKIWSDYYNEMNGMVKYKTWKEGDELDYDTVKAMGLQQGVHYDEQWKGTKKKMVLSQSGAAAATRSEYDKANKDYAQRDAKAAANRDKLLAANAKQFQSITSQLENTEKDVNVPKSTNNKTTNAKEHKSGNSAIDKYNDNVVKAEDEEEARRDAAEERAKQETEDRRKLEDAELAAMQDGEAKVAAQRKIEQKRTLEDIDADYRARQLAIIKNEKEIYDKQQEELAKQGKKRGNYYETDQFKSHFSDDKQQDLIINPADAAQMEMLKSATITKQNYENAKAQSDSLKELDNFFNKRITIEQKYVDEQAKLEAKYKAGYLDNETYDSLIKKSNANKQAELDKSAFEDFKGSPALQMAMSDGTVDYSAIERAYAAVQAQIGKAQNDMNPADFQAFVDTYQQICDKLIEANPFDALSKSVAQLKKDEAELATAHENTQKVYKDYGLDEYGQAQNGSEMERLQNEYASAQSNQQIAQENLNAAQGEETLNQEKIRKAQDELTAAINRTVAAKNNLTRATNTIQSAENRESNANAKVQSTTNKVKKAQEKAKTTAISWADAVKQAAEMYKSPITDAIAQMANLISTTLNSIQAVYQAAQASAQGVQQVSMAVTRAVAILAIIQAAWQLINSIMSIFSGQEEKKYQEKVSALKGDINALDYQFNVLKEDMDDMWGTDALEQYMKSIDTLADKQSKQLQLIKLQSEHVNGHHSLNYYQNKNSGLTDSDWQKAKDWFKEQGWEIDGSGIDILYSLTPEQMKKFLASGIGTYITGALGGVKGTGDYSGSDWLSDIQAYADSVDDVEDLTDELQEKINGITFDSLKDNLEELVTTFDTSLNDINNNFDEFMRQAAYNNQREKLESELQDWYNELDALNTKRAQGMDAEEYRKELAKLREKYENLVKKAQDDYQTSLTEAGINVKDVEQSASEGGFDSMSEDTGQELNGRFASMQEQETVTATNTGLMVQQLASTMSIADEIRTIQVNSYLSLQAIEENTRKIVEPIMGMREDVNKIKENVDRL